MFTETAEFYDLIYCCFKDYRAEAAAVATVLCETLPPSARILDVACGTGEHARLLHDEHGYQVDGIDLEPSFIDIARRKNPTGIFEVGDMATLNLNRRYDALLCLGSSIGYMAELGPVTRTLRRLREHVETHGVVVVEPWLTPSVWKAGTISSLRAESEGVSVARMSRSGVEGRISTLEFHYLIGTPDGIDHRVEHHRLGLFSREEMEEAFADAGFREVVYDEVGLTGRGLYTAGP
jgi:ubiquinone/menaquinone biosynthesis C-methylase UbiE